MERRKLFEIYSYIAPTLLFPSALWLWYTKTGKISTAFMIVMLPVIVSYIVPAIGTNYLKLWEFKTRFMAGKFRIQHGFLFGSASAIFALAVFDFSKGSLVLMAIKNGFVLGSVIALWNWIYDIYAIKSGTMAVYTKGYYLGKSEYEIAFDYAPVYFGVFGFIYGIAIESVLAAVAGAGGVVLVFVYLTMVILALLLPTTAYMMFSIKRYGENGLKSYRQENN